MAKIRVCVAGATGWTGSAVTKAILASSDFQLTGAIARKKVGEDAGTVLGSHPCGVPLSAGLEATSNENTDVLVDYIDPTSVQDRAM